MLYMDSSRCRNRTRCRGGNDTASSVRATWCNCARIVSDASRQSHTPGVEGATDTPTSWPARPPSPTASKCSGEGSVHADRPVSAAHTHTHTHTHRHTHAQGHTDDNLHHLRLPEEDEQWRPALFLVLALVVLFTLSVGTAPVLASVNTCSRRLPCDQERERRCPLPPQQRMQVLCPPPRQPFSTRARGTGLAPRGAPPAARQAWASRPNSHGGSALIRPDGSTSTYGAWGRTRRSGTTLRSRSSSAAAGVSASASGARTTSAATVSHSLDARASQFLPSSAPCVRARTAQRRR
jgi:hypothetical protein